MFGPPPLTTFIRQFLKIPDNLLKVLHIETTIEYLSFLYFFGFALPLRLKELIKPFPGLTKLYFGSEDVIIILYRLPNFSEMF